MYGTKAASDNKPAVRPANAEISPTVHVLHIPYYSDVTTKNRQFDAVIIISTKATGDISGVPTTVRGIDLFPTDSR